MQKFHCFERGFFCSNDKMASLWYIKDDLLIKIQRGVTCAIHINLGKSNLFNIPGTSALNQYIIRSEIRIQQHLKFCFSKYLNFWLNQIMDTASEILRVQMVGIIQTMQTWLQSLLQSYVRVEMPMSDLLYYMDIIRIAQIHLAKTQSAYTQYQRLTIRIQNLENRIDRLVCCRTIGTRSYMYIIWNQIQVYAGARKEYLECMERSINKMVNCCAALEPVLLPLQLLPPSTDTQQWCRIQSCFDFMVFQ